MKRTLFILLFLTPGLLMAQDELVATLSKQLEDSRTNFPAMRPQVFFSQDKYAPGDTAFFRLFILTETESILAERSLLTLELVNPKGLVCARQVVTSQRYGAANQLILPDSLSAGWYEVRLFSDRMTLAYGLSVRVMIVNERQMVRQPARGEAIRFFPEGGHLVTGALNRVVIRALGNVPVSAALISDEGRLMSVAFDESGLGEAQFVPQRDRKYWLEYVIGEKSLMAPLPETEPEAIALRIYRGPKKTYVLDLNTGPKGPRSAFLLIVAARQVLHSQEIRFKSDRANILVSSDFFPEGFSEVFVVNEERKILAYRPLYVPVQAAAQISFTGLPEAAALRQDVKVTLKLVDAEGKPVSAGLAVSVIPDNVRQRPLRTPDATLELRPAPPFFDWTQSSAKLDREIVATQLPQGIVPEYPPLIHRSNLTLTGRAFSKDPSTTLPYLSRMVIYLQEDKIQYETAIDGAGNFEFSKIYDFLGSDKVYYKVLHLGKQVPQVGIAWTSTSGEFVPFNQDNYIEGTQSDSYGQLRKRKKSVDHSFTYFLSADSTLTKVDNYNAKLESEFRGPDITINPGEYVSFGTMRELMLEVIPNVRFRVNGKDSVILVDLRTNSPLVPMRYPEGNPLYVIDGCLTSNTSYLMSLSPKDLISVKVIQDIEKLNRLENLAKDGVLFIQTRIPERTRRDLGRELHPMEGLSPTLSMATRYSTKARVPDLRSLLYWSPLLDADSTGTATFSFRTSDLPGSYWIRVMGTTTTGHLVTGEQQFMVNFK